MAEVLVLHTMDAPAGSTYANNVAYLKRNMNIAPNWCCDPNTGQVDTLWGDGVASKSLENHPGGVQTNNRAGGVRQLEIYAWTASIHHQSGQWFSNLAKIVRDLCGRTGVPILFPCAFPGARLTAQQWLSVKGIVGHCHVPENNHTDPGDISRLVALLTKPVKPTEEDDMPGIHQLGAAMSTVKVLYANRGRLMSAKEESDWAKDIEGKLAQGEDLASTYDYIRWALNGGK